MDERIEISGSHSRHGKLDAKALREERMRLAEEQAAAQQEQREPYGDGPAFDVRTGIRHSAGGVFQQQPNPMIR